MITCANLTVSLLMNCPNRSGVFLHLIPVYSALLTGVLLGEPLMAYHVLGFALILAGVWFAARKS